MEIPLVPRGIAFSDVLFYHGAICSPGQVLTWKNFGQKSSLFSVLEKKIDTCTLGVHFVSTSMHYYSSDTVISRDLDSPLASLTNEFCMAYQILSFQQSRPDDLHFGLLTKCTVEQVNALLHLVRSKINILKSTCNTFMYDKRVRQLYLLI